MGTLGAIKGGYCGCTTCVERHNCWLLRAGKGRKRGYCGPLQAENAAIAGRYRPKTRLLRVHNVCRAAQLLHFWLIIF